MKIAFAILIVLWMAFIVFARWMQKVQLPRLIAERKLLGIRPGQTYWSWPWQKKLEMSKPQFVGKTGGCDMKGRFEYQGKDRQKVYLETNEHS